MPWLGTRCRNEPVFTVGIAADTARLLFPSTVDLADSVLWSRVLGSGTLADSAYLSRSDGHRCGTEMPLVLGLLRRLRDAAEQLPGAITVLMRVLERAPMPSSPDALVRTGE